jgi:hypothetical protein
MHSLQIGKRRIINTSSYWNLQSTALLCHGECSDMFTKKLHLAADTATGSFLNKQ